MPSIFGQVPYVFTQLPVTFRDIWRRAQSQTVRIGLFGDSQETDTGGSGSVYIPNLNHQFWLRYRNTPETMALGHRSTGTGVAKYMLRGATASPGPSAARLNADQILPNIDPKAHSTQNNTLPNVNGQRYGQLTLLQHDCFDVDPGNLLQYGRYFDTTNQQLKARIYAATNASSGEVSYTANPQDGNSPNFFQPDVLTGTSALSLEDAVFAIKSFETPVLSYNGLTYMQMELFGSDDAKLTDIVGMRYVNASSPAGVVIDSFSAGGYKVSDVLANHTNAGLMLAALGPYDAIMMHFGANDSTTVSAVQFKTDTLALIAAIRGPSWLNDPSLPFILMSDAYRTGLTGGQQTEYDQFPGAMLEIAQSDPFIMAINTRRLLEDQGFNAANPNVGTEWLSDSVHLNKEAQRRMAAVEVAAMIGVEPEISPTVVVGSVSRQGRFQGTTGQSHYGIISQVNAGTPQLWDNIGGAFVDETAAIWVDCAITATETRSASGRFRVAVPASVPAGGLHITTYMRGGTAAVVGDTVIAQTDWFWDGTSLLALEQVDGISDLSMREALLAWVAGLSSVVDNGDGTKTITYTKQNGTTAKLTLTFNTAGEFKTTVIG